MKLLLPLVAAIAVFLVACGGGGEVELSPTGTSTAAPEAQATGAPASPTAVASMTAEERAATEALLKAAALQQQDLPEGFTLDGEKFTTNEESVAEESYLPGSPTLEDLDRFGRILGYEASYTRQTPLDSLTAATLSFQVTTDVYRDSKGADEHFEVVRQQPSDPEFVKAFQEGLAGSDVAFRDASISPMSFAKVGDDRMAFEIGLTARYPGLDRDVNLIMQVVAIRRGRGIGSIVVLDVVSPSPVGELEDLARTLDGRLQDALE